MVRALERELRSFPPFAELDADELEALARVCFVQDFPADVTLFWQGNDVDFVHGTLSGHVELSAYHNTRQYTVMVAEPGCLTPIPALAGQAQSLCTARTVTRSRIVLVPVAAVRRLADTNMAFLRAWFEQAVHCFQQLLREVHSRNLQRSSERLATWIFRRLGDHEGPQTVELTYNKRLLAAALGVSPATLARDIESLEEHGVTVKGRTVHVGDVARLRAAANIMPDLMLGPGMGDGGQAPVQPALAVAE